MVCLTITPAMLRALEELRKNGQVPEAREDIAEPSLKQPAIGNPITHGQIIAISKTLKEIKTDPINNDNVANTVSYHLDDLLRGSKVYIEPPKPKAEPTSEYKALMARLRREEEDRAYERMINPPRPMETFSQRFPNSPHAALFPAAQADIGENDEVSYADINRQMGLIINILISIVACSVAIWLAARHWSTPTRLGLSMGGSGIVSIAEVVVYAGYLRRIKEAREKGKKDVEIKEIIKTFVIGGRDGKGDKKGDEKGDASILVDAKMSKDDRLRRRKATSK